MASTMPTIDSSVQLWFDPPTGPVKVHMDAKRCYLALPLDVPVFEFESGLSVSSLKQTAEDWLREHLGEYTKSHADDKQLADALAGTTSAIVQEPRPHVTVCYGGIVNYEDMMAIVEAWFVDNGPVTDARVLGPIRLLDKMPQQLVCLIDIESAKIEALRQHLQEAGAVDASKTTMHPLHITLAKYVRR